VEKESHSGNMVNPVDLATVAARKAYLSRALSICTFISDQLNELQGLIDAKVNDETKMGSYTPIASFRARDVTPDNFLIKTVVDISGQGSNKMGFPSAALSVTLPAPAAPVSSEHRASFPSIPSVDVDDIGMGFFSSVDYESLRASSVNRKQPKPLVKASERAPKGSELCFGYFTKLAKGEMSNVKKAHSFAEDGGDDCSVKDRRSKDDCGRFETQSPSSTSSGESENLDILKDVAPESFMEGVVGVELIGNLTSEILYFADSNDFDRERYNQLHQVGNLFYFIFMRGGASPPPTEFDTREVSLGVSDFQNSLSLDCSANMKLEEGHSSQSLNSNERLDRSKRGKRIDPLSKFHPLRQVEVPYSICRLIFELLKSNTYGDIPPHTAFSSFEMLHSELNELICKPEVFLDDFEVSPAQRLKIQAKIYGRDKEINEILAAAKESQKDFNTKNHFVLVSGHSGSGKTRLVEEVKNHLLRDDWVVLTSSFEKLQSNHPLTPIFSSVEKFFATLVQKSKLRKGAKSRNEGHRIRDIINSVQTKIPSADLIALSYLVPSLGLLLSELPASHGESLVTSAENVNFHANRLRFLLRMLICSISSSEHPVMIFFDDAQWADNDFINDFVLDSTHLGCSTIGIGLERHILFVACYRVDSGNSDDSISIEAMFNQINHVAMTKIQVEDLTERHVDEIISESLSLPHRLTKPLSSVVHTKTAGNPLFTKSFLDSMIDDGKIRYSVEEKRWTWDIVVIGDVSIGDDVAKLFVRKLQRLPSEVQEALKVLSCFGQAIPKYAILNQNTANGLDLAITYGLLENDDELYKFAHSTIETAAYGLIADTCKTQFHFELGCSMVNNPPTGEEGITSILNSFGIDQINRSRPLTVNDQGLCRKFAQLNLWSGRRSMDSAGFETALERFEHGLSFLNDDSYWETDYELMLNLTDSASLASYITTKSDALEHHVNQTLTHAKTILDMFNAYSVHVRSLCTRGFESDAISLVLSVVRVLGEDFEDLNSLSSSTLNRLAKDELLSTRELLEATGKDQLLQFESMTDVNKLWVMKLMSYVIMEMFRSRPLLMAVLSCKMIKLSIHYGVCEATCIALIMYSVSMMDDPDNVDHCHYWGKVAQALFSTFDNPDSTMIHRIEQYFHSLVGVWIEPHQAVCNTFQSNYKTCVRSGDNETSTEILVWYCLMNTLCGANLLALDDAFIDAGRKMAEMFQYQLLVFLACLHEHVAKLAGKDGSELFHLTNGPFQNENELLDFAIANDKSKLMKTVYFMKLFDSFWSRDFARGRIHSTEYFSVTSTTSIDSVFAWFYYGLMAFDAARNQPTEKENYLRIGEESLSNMRKWATHSTWNYQNKLYLLEAEYYYTQDMKIEAKSKYELAIQSSKFHRFGHEEGLCFYLYSSFCSALGDISLARHHLMNARRCYERWGLNQFRTNSPVVMK